MGLGLGLRDKYKWYIFGLVFRLKKIQKNKVVVDNFFGRGYGDNPKYIVDELLKSDKDIDIVWVVSGETDTTSFPNGVRIVKVGSIESIYEWMTAKIWIDNIKNYYKNKRSGQFYLQTWHGGVSMKRVEKAVEDNLDKGYVNASKRDSKIIDAMLSNSSWQTNDYKTNFWYNGPIYEVGLPRNDAFFSNSQQITEKVKNFYGISDHHKIILYAPTFRNHKTISEQKELFAVDSDRIIQTCEKKFGSKYVFIERFHPGIANKLNIQETENVKNGNMYPDMQELLVASDILITDFSSSIFDFVLKSNRVFLYGLDYDDYLSKERGLNFDIKKELAFTFSNTQEELLSNIMTYDEERANENIKSMKELLGLRDDGNASKRIAKKLIDVMKG